jgi:hypothetical protein
MRKLKIFGLSVGVFVGIVAFVFMMGLVGLGYYKFFAPKKENIRREVFEQTQSYVHGKIQDLAKYKKEYDEAESVESKNAIRSVILVRFAEFDESKIKASALRGFLISMRGY